MKPNKAPGPDDLEIDLVKTAGEPLAEELAKLFTRCLEIRKIPEVWRKSNLTIIFKKGNKKELKNYRPISLLPQIYKIFTKIITKRIEKKLDEAQTTEQAGFRKGFSTMDHIHTINQLREKCNQYNLPLCLTFVDFEKAFDSVEIDTILQSLVSQGIELTYIHLLRDIYSNCTSTATLGENSIEINIKRGVRQGDTISPKLFTACLEQVFCNIDWKDKGINVDGKNLHHLKFADDIIIISKNLEDAESMLQDLNKESKSFGLSINKNKTKTMGNNLITARNIKLEGEDIEYVENYIYLGQNVNLTDKDMSKEINRRIQLGWMAFGKLGHILRSELPMCLKRKVFNQCIIPTMTYASETWTVTRHMKTRMKVTQRAMERTMLGITRRDRWKNEFIRSKTGVDDIITCMQKAKWRWAGHLARTEDDRWTKRCTEWTPRIGKRSRGRPTDKWDKEIVITGGATWTRLAKDRHKWRGRVEAFVQQWT